MPDFDTQTPPEQRPKPLKHRILLVANRLRSLVIASKPRIVSIANKLRALLIASKPRMLLLANRLRSLLMANRRRTVVISGGMLLFVAAVVTLGLPIYTSSGLGDQQQKVEVANGKPLRGGCLGEYRGFGSFNYSPDGQKIVFISYYNYVSDSTAGSASPRGTLPDEADDEICMVNADGTDMIRLTDNPNDESSVVWSPDGKKIAFVRYFWSNGDTRSPIVTMNVDGSDEVELPGTEHANWGVPRALAWSPDGESLAFEAPHCDIYITRADGSGTPRELTSDPAWQCSTSPAWSLDGEEIAFESERDTRPNVVGDSKDIYVMNALGEGGAGQWRHLTDDPANEAYPAWSPGGTEIAFSREHGDITGEIYEIYKVDADGSNETRLASGAFPTWLPDGKHVAYLRNGNIEVVNSDGSNPKIVIADMVE